MSVPFAVFYGPNRYLAIEGAKRLRAQCFAQDECLSMDASSHESLAAALAHGSLFASRRLIWMDGLDVPAALVERLAQSVSEQLAVIWIQAPLGRKRAILPARAELFPCVDLDVRGARTWVARRALQLQIALAARAVDDLVRALGTDMGLLDQELKKREGLPPTAARQPFDAVFFDGRPFAFTDAFAGRDMSRTLEQLSALWGVHEEPLRLVALLARELRLLSGQRANGLVGADVPSFVRARLERAARGWTERQLAQALAALSEVDSAIKAGASAQLTLERYVVGQLQS